MSTVIVERDLLASCGNPEYREALNIENVYVGICAQIRALREQRAMSQQKLGREAKMAQERISILEDPNAQTKPTLTTLLRLASAFDVGLDVRFVPFSALLERAVHTDQQDLEVPSFTDELPVLEKKLALESLVAVAKSRPAFDALDILMRPGVRDTRGIHLVTRQLAEQGVTAYNPPVETSFQATKVPA